MREHLWFGEFGAKKKNTNKIQQLPGTYISETAGAISSTYTCRVIYCVPCMEHSYGHAHNSHAWTMRGHTCAINIRYSSTIILQKHVEIQSTIVKEHT